MTRRNDIAADAADKVRKAEPGAILVYPQEAKFEMRAASAKGSVLLFKRLTGRLNGGFREFEDCALKLSPKAAKFVAAVSQSVPAPPRSRGADA